jgi:hypothetical protein
MSVRQAVLACLTLFFAFSPPAAVAATLADQAADVEGANGSRPGSVLVRAAGGARGILYCRQAGGFAFVSDSFEGETVVEGVGAGKLEIFLRVPGTGSSRAVVVAPADGSRVEVEIGDPSGGSLVMPPRGPIGDRPLVTDARGVEWGVVLETTALGDAKPPRAELLPEVRVASWVFEDLPPGRYTVEIPGRLVRSVEVKRGKQIIVW